MIPGCGVCIQNLSKYKCPKCYLPFCSAICGNKHKDSPECSPCNNGAPHVEDIDVDIEWITDNTVPATALAKLNENSKLKELLRDQNLRNILKTTDTASDPASALVEAMKDPVFLEFVEICLSTVQPEETLKT